MISGWFSGQPVAKAVTKSADVDRLVSEDPIRRHERGDFDLDFRTFVDQP